MNLADFINNGSLEIIVKAGSSKNEITGYDESRKAVKVNIKAPAENNRANVEIIKYFSKLTGKNIKIISGHTGKRKILKID